MPFADDPQNSFCFSTLEFPHRCINGTRKSHKKGALGRTSREGGSVGVRRNHEPVRERTPAQHGNTCCPELRSQASVQPVSCPIPRSWASGSLRGRRAKGWHIFEAIWGGKDTDKTTHCFLGCWKQCLSLPSDTDAPPGPALMLSGVAGGEGSNLGLLASSRVQSSLSLLPEAQATISSHPRPQLFS